MENDGWWCNSEEDDRWMYGLWQQEESDELDLDNSTTATLPAQTTATLSAQSARGAAPGACEVRLCTCSHHHNSIFSFVDLQLSC